MSIWKVSPTEGTEDSEPFVRNAIAWDQLLNNLDLQTSSESSEDDAEEAALRSHASVFSESRRSYRDGKVKARSTSAGSKECAQPNKSLNATRDDDGYSSEDEHDSPANPDSSDSGIAGFCPSSGLTTTSAKIGSAMSGSSEPASPNEPTKTYFYINGVRHCVQDEQNGVKWSGAGIGLQPMATTAVAAPTAATPVKMPLAQLPAWGAAFQPSHNSSAAPMAKTVIASNEAGAPAAWVYAPKAAAQTSMPMPSPPRYDAGRTLPGSYPTVPSLEHKTMAAAPTGVSPSMAYYPSCNGIPMGVPPPMPAPYTPSRAAMPPMNAAPVYGGGNTASAAHNAAPAANSILGYVYVDSNGCLRVASRGDSPLPPPPPPLPASTCPPPPPPMPSQPQPQLARRSSEAAAMYQGASSVPGMNPMQYAAAYAADGSVCVPSVPPMPVSTSPSASWGSTKAWAFRDGRWISLSM